MICVFNIFTYVIEMLKLNYESFLSNIPVPIEKSSKNTISVFDPKIAEWVALLWIYMEG